MLTQFVLLPLYIYPSSGAWQKLYDVIPSNPSLPFYVVINPADGPGTGSNHPDSQWIQNVALLNSYPNVKTLGYVHTTEATRNINDTYADIATYAKWANYNQNLHMDGIFFDEAPSIFDENTSSYMSSVSTYAKTSLGANRDYIVFNAGAQSPIVINKGFYALADTIIVFEDYASNFKAADVAKIASTLRSQSAFIVHDYSGSTSGQTDIVDDLIDYGVAGVYVTDSTTYSSWGSKWSSFVSAMTKGSFNSKTSVSNTASSNVGAVTGHKKRWFSFVA